MKTGKFLTFEGCEGVGKSTQIAMLKEYFAQRGVDAVFVREPGGTKIGEQIRQLILSPSSKISPMTELFLYAAARSALLDEVIIPSLKSGKIVVCDRFADSTVAYQGYGRGLKPAIVATTNEICLSDINPDLTLFLDLQPSEGFKRKGGADKQDRMDSESLAFHNRVYCGYKQLAQQTQRIKAIDASGTAASTHQKIIDAILHHKII